MVEHEGPRAVGVRAAQPCRIGEADALERGRGREAGVEHDELLVFELGGDHGVEHVLVGVEQRVARVVVAEVRAPVIDAALAVGEQRHDPLARRPAGGDQARVHVTASAQRPQAQQRGPGIDEAVGVVGERHQAPLGGRLEQRGQGRDGDHVGVDQDHGRRRHQHRQPRLERERPGAGRGCDDVRLAREQAPLASVEPAVEDVDPLPVPMAAQRVDQRHRAEEVLRAADAVERRLAAKAAIGFGLASHRAHDPTPLRRDEAPPGAPRAGSQRRTGSS